MAKALVDDLRDYVNLTHALAWERATQRGTTPDEPGLVASFLDSSLQNHLQSILLSQYTGMRKLNMQLNSIFTHKTPVVTPAGAANGVEIADLMLIRQHFAVGGSTPRTAARALLLQAKRNTQPHSGHVGSGNPKIQFELYQSWRPFKGSSYLSKGPDGQGLTDWDFNPAKLTAPPDYGHYLAVFDGHAFDYVAAPQYLANPSAGLIFPASNYPMNPPHGSTWANAPVSASDTSAAGVACHIDFAQTLEQFVLGTAGQPFTPGVSTGSDHWSIFVNQMLLTAASSQYTYTSKRTGVASGAPRGRQIQAFMAIQPYMSLAAENFRLPWRERHLSSWPLEYYRQFFQYFRYDELKEFRSRAFVKDVVRYWDRTFAQDHADGNGVLPPRVDTEAPDDYDDAGHVPVLILATSGEDMPEEWVNHE